MNCLHVFAAALVGFACSDAYVLNAMSMVKSMAQAWYGKFPISLVLGFAPGLILELL